MSKEPRQTKTALSQDEKVGEIVALIESGKSERAACEQIGMSRSTFRSAALRLQMADQYAKALAALAHAQAEKLEQAIDDMREGKIDHHMARVEIDARKWFASKFLPKQYGDRIAQEISGPDGGPVRTSSEITPEMEERIAAARAKIADITPPGSFRGEETEK